MLLKAIPILTAGAKIVATVLIQEAAKDAYKEIRERHKARRAPPAPTPMPERKAAPKPSSFRPR